MSLLSVSNVTVSYEVEHPLFRPARRLRAVDGVTLEVEAGETVAIVGESGCGKTSLARAIAGLVPVDGGAISLDGRPYHTMSAVERRSRNRRVQMVFQNPYDSLNPRKSVYETLAQPLLRHGVVPRRQVHTNIEELLTMVGLSPPETYMRRYPRQFSGGQRQRIGIARALAPQPDILVADEAVSALDVSIRAQILVLLRRLQAELGVAYVFVTHDLGVVRAFASRVVVMYLGRIVESGSCDEVFEAPAHAYTRALIEASPVPDPDLRDTRLHAPLQGDVPSPLSPPSGCRFRTRCPLASEVCRREPETVWLSGSHQSACHFAKTLGKHHTNIPELANEVRHT